MVILQVILKAKTKPLTKHTVEKWDVDVVQLRSEEKRRVKMRSKVGERREKRGEDKTGKEKGGDKTRCKTEERGEKRKTVFD